MSTTLRELAPLAAAVVRALLDDPDGEKDRDEIARLVDVDPAPVVAALNTLIQHRWVICREPAGPGPQRRYYQLTVAGIANAASALRNTVRRDRLGEVTLHAPVRLVLLVLLQPDGRSWHRNAIAERLGLEREAVGDVLRRLLRAGWVTWELASAPPYRVFVALTDEGAARARAGFPRGFAPADIELAAELGLSLNVGASPEMPP